jgi:hypothetical protein
VVVGAAATESRRLKRVTEEEHQLMDPNTAPRIVTDGEGELAFTHTTTTKFLNFPVYGDLDRLVSFLNAVY